MKLLRVFSLFSQIVMFLFLTQTSSPAQTINLTGLWQDDTGGGAVYRVRQVDKRIYWIVDGTSKGSYTNLFYGEISGNAINGIWVDLPGSPTLGGGNLTLRIESNDRFVKVGASPNNYGAQAWIRQGSSGGGSVGTGGGSGTPITWNQNPAINRGQNGKQFTYLCPPAPNASEIRGVYGTDVYLDDSGICLAAIHAGLITPAGGTVTIEIRPGQASYVGSTRNGVTSSTAGQYPGSFVFIREGGSAGLGFLRTPINIAGTWNSSLGLVYEITQSGSNFSWRVTNNAAYNETAHGEFLERDKIKATWTNNNGTDSGQAQVTDVDANGRAKRITWANRVVFTRN